MTAIDTTSVPSAPNGSEPPAPVDPFASVVKRRPSYPDRVAARAEGIRFVRVVMAVIAAPFYLLGLVVGVVWLAARWCIGAVAEGFDTARRTRSGEGGT